jgi:ATP-binding cassette, subfamily B, bacterial
MTRKRVPFVPQMETAECGAAALAMVLGHHGHHAPLSEVREACGVSRDGASAWALVHAARAYGLESEGVRVDVEDLPGLALPAILHWGFSHFLVLESFDGRRASVVDPAAGPRVVDADELCRLFTGVAIVASPGPAFARRRRERPSLARYGAALRTCRLPLALVLGASTLLQLVGLAFPIGSQLLLDHVIRPQQEAWLWGLALGLSGAVAAKAALALVRSFVIQGLQASMDLGLMGDFVGHLLRLPLGFFLQRRTGDLIQRVHSNTVIGSLFGSQSVSALLDGLLLLAYGGLMLAYHVRLAAVVLAAAALRVAILMATRRRIEQSMAAELAAAGREGAALLEAVSALETTQAARAEDHVAARWTDRTIERVNAGLPRRRLDIAFRQVMVFLQGATLAAVFAIGGAEVLGERMTVGVFASFLTLQALFMGPLEALVESGRQLQLLDNHLRRLDDVLDAQPEPSGSLDPGRLSGAIELDGVSFAYTPRGPQVVQGVGLQIHPGEKIAIVGPTGAGKSSLARLLLGLHLPTAGTVRFDGRDLRELDLERVRRQIGVVMQEPFLFGDSIRANLSLGDPEIPLERLMRAARRAAIHDVIAALPQGYDTPVGERGCRLSVGQRQRLALARALARDPVILLLDEATSALDHATEARVHTNLAELGCTRIVIAHRLETVRDADRIYVVQNGRLVQQGRFEDLSEAPGLFRDLVGGAVLPGEARAL